MVKKKGNKSAKIDLLRMADFVLLNTMIFHEVLSNQFKGVKSLRNMKKNLQVQLLSDWNAIKNNINYGPIFKLSIQVLNAFPTDPLTESTLSVLKDLALSVVSSGVHLRHDLMGRIYHRLLLQTMGGYYATYFTSVPAAVLLSDLLIKTENDAWNFSDSKFIAKLKIIDPACGSGTLLSSTYSAIRDKFIMDHPAPTIAELAKLHVILMENCIFGLDVLDYASHLTLTTLAMHNPKSKFLRSNIYTLPNGVAKDGRVFLGSIDYLDPQRALLVKQWGSTAIQDVPDSDNEISLDLKPSSFDCVVMNPPFSRSANPNLKFGYAPPIIRKKMGDRLKQITNSLGFQGIGVAGLGAPFIVLGHKLLKEKGRIGIVIPRSILSGVSWSKIRSLIWNNYEIEYIISNFDPGSPGKNDGWCWSENTDLGEVLIVARKLKLAPEKKKCLFINFIRSPKNEVESLLTSQLIRHNRDKLRGSLGSGYWTDIQFGQKLAGFAYYMDQLDMLKNWHMGCLFSHPELVSFGLDLCKNHGLVELGPELQSKGRDIAVVKKNFAPSRTRTSFPMLYGHQSTMNSIYLGNSHLSYGQPTTGLKAQEMHKAFSSDLLIAERPHINSECLLAIEVAEPVLATAFWEIRLKNDDLRPLILLWLNSTFGFFAALGAGANSKGPIFKIKQEHLDDILIPKPTPTLIQDAEKLYQSIKTNKFQPFPVEFQQAATGKGTRIIIDDFFVRLLGFKTNMRKIYQLLVDEPALAGRPRPTVSSPANVAIP